MDPFLPPTRHTAPAGIDCSPFCFVLTIKYRARLAKPQIGPIVSGGFVGLVEEKKNQGQALVFGVEGQQFAVLAGGKSGLGLEENDASPVGPVLLLDLVRGDAVDRQGGVGAVAGQVGGGGQATQLGQCTEW